MKFDKLLDDIIIEAIAHSNYGELSYDILQNIIKEKLGNIISAEEIKLLAEAAANDSDIEVINKKSGQTYTIKSKNFDPKIHIKPKSGAKPKSATKSTSTHKTDKATEKSNTVDKSKKDVSSNKNTKPEIKDKTLKPINSIKEFNSNKTFSSDGISDENFNKNPNVKSVKNKLDLKESDYEKIFGKTTVFPKKYIKVLDRLLNTIKSPKLAITNFTDVAGAGTLASTTGELLTLMMSSISDDKVAKDFADKLIKHIKDNGKDNIIDVNWVKSAYKVRTTLFDEFNIKYGKGKWKLAGSAWDTKNEVESLGLSDYEKNKGFSTDIYIKVIDANGKFHLNEISLKKDALANFLNITTGRVTDILIRGRATKQELQKYEELATKTNGWSIFSNLTAEEKKWYKEMQSKYTTDIPDEVNVEKVKTKQKELHLNNLTKNKNELQNSLKKFSKLSSTEQEKLAITISSELNQGASFAPELLKSMPELIDKLSTGDLDFNSIKLAIESGVSRDINKTAMIITALAAAMNPKGKCKAALDEIKQNSYTHSNAVAEYLLNDESAKSGLIESIKNDFPIKALLEGEETMILGDLIANDRILTKLFGVDNFDKVKEKLTIVTTPPPPAIVYTVNGKKQIPVAIIKSRPDGIGYGETWKLEMQIHPEFAKELKTTKDKLAN
ncbi:MAG TPA: hypothetical protein PLY35_10355 [Thermotogota bacterium]|nr:hypothetical protein [Thermotogota bacterium]